MAPDARRVLQAIMDMIVGQGYRHSGTIARTTRFSPRDPFQSAAWNKANWNGRRKCPPAVLF